MWNVPLCRHSASFSFPWTLTVNISLHWAILNFYFNLCLDKKKKKKKNVTIFSGKSATSTNVECRIFLRTIWTFLFLAFCGEEQISALQPKFVQKTSAEAQIFFYFIWAAVTVSNGDLLTFPSVSPSGWNLDVCSFSHTYTVWQLQTFTADVSCRAERRVNTDHLNICSSSFLLSVVILGSLPTCLCSLTAGCNQGLLSFLRRADWLIAHVKHTCVGLWRPRTLNRVEIREGWVTCWGLSPVSYCRRTTEVLLRVNILWVEFKSAERATTKKYSHLIRKLLHK